MSRYCYHEGGLSSIMRNEIRKEAIYLADYYTAALSHVTCLHVGPGRVRRLLIEYSPPHSHPGDTPLHNPTTARIHQFLPVTPAADLPALPTSQYICIPLHPTGLLLGDQESMRGKHRQLQFMYENHFYNSEVNISSCFCIATGGRPV